MYCVKDIKNLEEAFSTFIIIAMEAWESIYAEDWTGDIIT